MKKTYINPQVIIVTLGTKTSMMTMSVNDREISESNAGLVKENESYQGGSSSVWDNEW